MNIGKSSVLFLLLLFVTYQLHFSFAYANNDDHRCSRVISLAPSISEVMIALKLDNTLVGISDYDTASIFQKPLNDKRLHRIGGFLNINLEQILLLKPSLIFALKENQREIQKLRELEQTVEILEHRNIEGIVNSLKQVGSLCGKIQEAQDLVKYIHDTIETIKKDTLLVDREPKNVMIVVGRDEDPVPMKSIYISGKDSFYSDLLKIAGAKNVFKGITASAATITTEGIIALNPDIIIEIIATPSKHTVLDSSIQQFWSYYKTVTAVKNKKIYIIRDDYATIPGPRFTDLLKKFHHIIEESN
jgi:iron complex transport system substrate-binding protein